MKPLHFVSALALAAILGVGCGLAWQWSPVHRGAIGSPEPALGRYQFIPDKPVAMGSLFDTATGRLWIMMPGSNLIGIDWMAVDPPE